MYLEKIYTCQHYNVHTFVEHPFLMIVQVILTVHKMPQYDFYIHFLPNDMTHNLSKTLNNRQRVKNQFNELNEYINE